VEPVPVLHGNVTIHKGFFKFEDFLAAYKEHDVDAHQALVHFRITTRGDDTVDNCHPFPLANGALIHNGTLDNLGERGKGKSDTRMLAELLYGEDMETLKRLQPLLEAYFDYNRVAVMHNSGEVLVFNRSAWVEEDGILYSNNTYKAPTWAGLAHYTGGKLVDDGFDLVTDWRSRSAPRSIGVDEVDAVEAADMGDEYENWMLEMQDTYPNLWFDVNYNPHYEAEHDFQSTWHEAGFFWDENFDLWTMDSTTGLPVRNLRLENQVFYVWSNVLNYTSLPDANDQEEMQLLYNITYDIIQEDELCKSTPSVTAPPTATRSASSPPTLMGTTPSPSSSTTSSLACAAT
jgi:hypothetical protein